jgi:fructose-specific phosphotransferase system IIC component
MSKVSVKGVLIGGVVDVVTSVVLDFPFAFYIMSKLDLSRVPKNQIGARITAALHGNLPLYVGQLLLGLACSVLGGYIAARLAKRDELLNGLLSSWLCVALGVYSMASGKDSNALWVQVFLLVASPACALLGGALMRRQRQRRAQTA